MGPIGCPETLVKYSITTTRCVTTQKNAVLIYCAAEALNHTQYTSIGTDQFLLFIVYKHCLWRRFITNNC
jgi:hypothetical protein